MKSIQEEIEKIKEKLEDMEVQNALDHGRIGTDIFLNIEHSERRLMKLFRKTRGSNSRQQISKEEI